jgi:hypothetical protein
MSDLFVDALMHEAAPFFLAALVVVAFMAATVKRTLK